MSRPLATARRSRPPEWATTSTRKVCAERPCSSAATGPDGSAACRSSTALADMKVAISAVSRCVGMMALSAVVNSPTTGRAPIGAGNVHSVRGASPVRYCSRRPA
jgi:hypothetical protein